MEEQPEVASTLKVEFVDANNASVKETVEQALTSKYVGKTINLDELGIDINVEGYTLTEIKDKNDNTQVYTTETKDFVLTGNVTELQFVYTQNVQTDQPEESEDSNAQQGGQEDSNSTQEQEEADEEDSDSQADKEDESKEETKEEELAYPEQILSVTASDGAIITIIAKEGALPEGAEVVAEPVESDSVAQIVEDALSQEGKELQAYKAYNITILLDGEEIQPEVPIQVGITGSGISGTDKSLFHIADGSSTAEKVSAIDTGNTQTFSAEGFSIYVVAGSESSINEGEGSSEKPYQMVVGDIIKIEEKDNDVGGSWSVIEGDDIIQLSDQFSGYVGIFGYRRNPSTKIKALDTGKAVVRYSYGRKNNNHVDYYITIDDSDSIRVRWIVGGTVQETDRIQEGETPEYNGRTPSRSGLFTENLEFVGWATESGSVDYVTEDELGPVTEDTDYYAVFRVHTYYYFVLPGRSNTSTSPGDYMYAGDGYALIPNEYTGERWYNSNHSISSYAVEPPTDAEIRQGLSTYIL